MRNAASLRRAGYIATPPMFIFSLCIIIIILYTLHTATDNLGHDIFLPHIYLCYDLFYLLPPYELDIL